MRKIRVLAFRVFKKKKIYWRLYKFIDENYIGYAGWGTVDKLVQPKQTAKSTASDDDSFITARVSCETMRIINSEKRPVHACEEGDGDFEAVFDIFNKRRSTPEQSRKEKVEQLVVAAEKKEKFSACMLRFIDAKGLSDADVYNKVYMDRRLFNHIRNDPDYQPSKRTALLIAVSLKLTYEETQSLLETAGYTLTHSNKRDLIVEFFIQEGNYNIFEINEMLEHFKQPLLMKCD